MSINRKRTRKHRQNRGFEAAPKRTRRCTNYYTKRANHCFRFHGFDVENGMWYGMDAIGYFVSRGQWIGDKVAIWRPVITPNCYRWNRLLERNATTDEIIDQLIDLEAAQEESEEEAAKEAERERKAREYMEITGAEECTQKMGVRNSWKIKQRPRSTFGANIKPWEIPDNQRPIPAGAVKRMQGR